VAVAHAPATEVLHASALELARAIRAGALTSRAVVDAHIERLEAFQPRTGALAVPCFDAAREAAADADAWSGGERPPLHGVPCTIKESFACEGLPNAAGLTSVLLGDVTLAEALQPVPDVERLQVLAAGPTPPNPSEILSLRRTSEIIVQLGANGGFVLVDSSPVLAVTDAAVMSRKVDAVLVVCMAAVTTTKDASRAVELLEQVDAPLVGAILNGVTEEGGYGYGYSYRYQNEASTR